jgi:hypothetical protein
LRRLASGVPLTEADLEAATIENYMPPGKQDKKNSK